MKTFTLSIELLLFIYDGEGHKRTIGEIELFLLSNNLSLSDFNALLAPLISYNAIITNSSNIEFKCYSSDQLRQTLIILYLYHNQKFDA